ncbi:unnamed protein product [Caenorhabditis angaria]|uniref:7TM GPCR serpentine receptor class x (Srx) domain-containing protein n=1 Tax=Caenorhabditis angaria TaxID=860376 RepID=A0A9P1IWA7_9PELO|nr:unnamed protein product [Caenorhabditis angaria]
MFGFYIYSMMYVQGLTMQAVSAVTGSTLIISSLILFIYLTCISSRVYYETQGKLSLNKRFKLSQSYELSKSFIVPITTSIFFKIALFASYGLMAFVPADYLFPMFSFWNMVLNIDTSLFPVLFLLTNRTFKKKIRSMFFEKARVHQVRTLTGKNIQKNETHHDHFLALRQSWN